MVAAFGDELAGHVEFPARFLPERRRSGDGGQDRRRRARLDEAVERREGFSPRQRQPRAFERAVGEVKPHRPGLGDLLSFVEIAPRVVPLADSATEGCAGKKGAAR
jgi:hypothetical protein